MAPRSRSKSSKKRSSHSRSRSRSSSKRRSGSTRKRTFTVVRSSAKGNHTGGVYKSTSPAGAARKAASQIDRSGHMTGSSLTVCVRETTQGSAHKERTYTAHKMAVNKTIVRGGVTIPIKKMFKVKAHKRQGCHTLSPKKKGTRKSPHRSSSSLKKKSR